MRLAVNHAYFFPYLGYFQAIAAVDRYLLYEHFDYIKDGWMHRNRLQGRNHAPFQFTAHVSGRSSHRRISEMKLIETRGWRRKLKKSLVQNYRGASHFEETYAMAEVWIDTPEDTLHGFNAATIDGICRHLGVDTEIVRRNEGYLELEQALEAERKDSDSGLPAKVRRLLTMCAREGATTYVNAIGGTGLYREEWFREVGVDLRFLRTELVPYPQFHEPFTPNLSILDVLMSCGREGTRKLLNCYRLVSAEDTTG